MERRDFIKLMSAVTGSVMAGCNVKKNSETLIPYLVPPDDGVIPGVPSYVSSTCTECPAACGMQVKVLDHHPVKLEGNPYHPHNSGALCVRGQASLARLYHPNRVKEPLLKLPDGTYQFISWDDAYVRLRAELGRSSAAGRENVYLTGAAQGGSLDGLVTEFCGRFKATEFRFEIISNLHIREANRLVFGLAAVPAFHMDRADFVLTVGADLLDTFINPVEFGRQFAKAREHGGLSWFHAEPHLTLTGQRADERLLMKPGSEPALLAYLLGKLNVAVAGVQVLSLEDAMTETGLSKTALDGLVGALKQARRPLLIAGGVSTSDSASGLRTAVLAAVIQKALRMHESTIDFSRRSTDGSLKTVQEANDLARRLEQGKVGVLLHTRAAAGGAVQPLSGKLGKAGFRVSLVDIPTELDKTADLVLPLSHGLESWGDASPRVGVTSLIQPTIEPLYSTKSEGDILLSLLGSKQIYQHYLISQWKTAGSDWIDRGVRTHATSTPALSAPQGQLVDFLRSNSTGPSFKGMALVIAPSIRAFDGRSSALQLLREIPDPISTVTYDETVWVSPEDAKKFNLAQGDEVRITCGAGSLNLPVKVQSGLPPGVLQVSVESARAFDKWSEGSRFELSFILMGCSIAVTGSKTKLPVLSAFEGEAPDRGLIQKKVEARKAEVQHAALKEHTFFPDHPHENYHWNMVIDLDRCTGCSACVAACYVENNVPMVGREEHLRGREMSWIRIEPKAIGKTKYGAPYRLGFQPMMCQHCEHAPCETVCPVYATYHNPEGLNAQVYNRCVGTRYCANNCPYKVRRFNWKDNPLDKPMTLMLNPDVMKRPTGVMEKCTFCVQRIRTAKDHARDDGRLVRDGEVVPACAQSCPTQAIRFGNVKDPDSRVAKLAKDKRAFRALEEVGTKPNVIYLESGKGSDHEV